MSEELGQGLLLCDLATLDLSDVMLCYIIIVMFLQYFAAQYPGSMFTGTVGGIYWFSRFFLLL